MFHEANRTLPSTMRLQGASVKLASVLANFHSNASGFIYEIRVLCGAAYIGRSQYRPIGQMIRTSRIIVDSFTAPNSSSVLRTASNASV